MLKKIDPENEKKITIVSGVPVPTKASPAATGASLGGVGGVALAALALSAGPVGLALAAAAGAGLGAYIGAMRSQ